MKLAKPACTDPVSGPKQNKYFILRKHTTVVVVAIEVSCVHKSDAVVKRIVCIYREGEEGGFYF